VDGESKGERERHPNRTPDGGLTQRNLLRSLVKNAEVEREDSEDDGVEPDPAPERVHAALRAGATGRLATLKCVANVEKDLEVELLPPVGKIECRHLALIAGGLGPLECFAVHLVKIVQNCAART